MPRFNGQLGYASFYNSASDLTPTSTGLFYFNTTSTTFKWYTGAAWVTAADTSTAQTFTNKTLTAPVIDQVLYTEAAAPSTPASGKLAVYAKTDSKLYSKNSSGVETAIGSGSGSGEINAIEAPNDANGWAASGAGITVATTSTASDLPLGPIIDTAIKITPVSGTDYVYYRWTIPEALKNKKLKFEWHQRPLSGYASGDIKAEIYKNSASNYGGSYTEFSLSTDVSGTTSIPNQTGKFTTYFESDSADYYELRFVRVAGTTALNVVSVIVGPNTQPQGSVLTSVTSWTPDFSNDTGLSFTGSATYQRSADALVMKVSVAFTGVGSDASPLRLALPFTGITGVAGEYAGGNAGIKNADVNNRAIVVRGVSGQNYVEFATATSPTSSLNGTAFNDTASSNAFYFLDFSVSLPIAEWAGSGTLNTAQNDVEYAFNTTTSVTTDTTSFGYGPAGVAIPNGAAAGGFTKTVNFSSPIQSTDKLTIEIQPSGTGPWLELRGLVDSVNISDLQRQGGTQYGIGIDSASGTTAVVRFGRYPVQSNTSYNAAAADWNAIASTTRWRVRKEAAGVAVGFGAATDSASGLLKKPRFQKKTLSTNYTTTTSNIQSFSGLTVGRIYKFTASAAGRVGTSGTNNSYIELVHNGSTILTAGVVGDQSAAQWDYYTTSVTTFTASATTLTINATVTGTGSIVAGGSNNTMLILEELNDYEETTAFT
jgi:hypothetical protein